MSDAQALGGARYVVDTNVVSELMRAAPDAAVEAWCDRTGAAKLAIAAPSIFELRYGVALLPAGARRDVLGERVEALLSLLFGPRVIGFGAAEAKACAALMAKKRALGESLDDHLPDAMIAACAQGASLAVATRNAGQFRGTGVKIVNPWARRR